MHYSIPCSGSITFCEKWLLRCASFTIRLALEQLKLKRGFLFPNIDGVYVVNTDGQEDRWSLLSAKSTHGKAGLANHFIIHVIINIMSKHQKQIFGNKIK